MTLTGLKVSVSEYHRMIADGAFASDERYELLEETIVRRRRQTPAHCCVRGLIDPALRERLPAGWHVRHRSGFTTADSELEPDSVVAAGEAFDYLARHPGPADTALVVEIRTDQMTDLDARVRVYARAAVIRLWVVEVDARTIIEHTGPMETRGEPRFRSCRTVAADGVLSFDLGGGRATDLSPAEVLPRPVLG